MPPKKKGSKKAAGNDDWEAELGEPIAPAAAAAAAPDAAGADDDDAAGGPGGLMNLMRKNKEKRKKKGLSEDFPEPEPEAPVEDLTAKAPVEASAEDEFAAVPDKKQGKGGKGKMAAAPISAAASTAGGDDEVDASGRVLTKAEKEKAKKEREKLRKKEQVSLVSVSLGGTMLTETWE